MGLVTSTEQIESIHHTFNILRLWFFISSVSSGHWFNTQGFLPFSSYATVIHLQSLLLHYYAAQLSSPQNQYHCINQLFSLFSMADAIRLSSCNSLQYPTSLLTSLNNWHPVILRNRNFLEMGTKILNSALVSVAPLSFKSRKRVNSFKVILYF